jgi:hypothetical protein
MRHPFFMGMIGLAVWIGLMAGSAWADGSHVTFQNGYGYYLQPGPAPLGAQLYPCPRPVPPVVGYTYITYQPFAPHEFLYKHCRTYRVHHSTDGRTRVFVWWH